MRVKTSGRGQESKRERRQRERNEWKEGKDMGGKRKREGGREAR